MEITRLTGVFLILVITPVVRSARWGHSMCTGWCTGNNKLFVGDFNGDGKTDLLCHRPSDGYKWIAFANENGEFTGTDWEAGIGWCWHDGGELHIGDFNGDGRSDMLCHDTNSGYKWVALANGNGDFSARTSWEAALGWCSHGDSELYIGDFNGDGRDDMLCHDTGEGGKWLAYANSDGSFDGSDWDMNLGWCWHHGSQLFIGDFNGDSKSDLLCHDGNGYKWIAYANLVGNFANGTGWEQGIGWCSHLNGEIYIGDFNDDGKDDLLCHDSGTGYKWVALANCQNNFSDKTSWEAGLGWCHQSSEEFHVGDFNGDGKIDMLCHDTSSGEKSIIYAEFTIFQ